MLYKVEYCTILGDHILAMPEPTEYEFIETDDFEKLIKYIEENKKDDYGHPYKYQHKKANWHSFKFTSHAGGVRVEKYTVPEIQITKL